MSPSGAESQKRPSALVLAFGNSLRRDDGFAWEAAKRLEARPLPQGVEIRMLHQLTPELALDLSECRAVVFVDARALGTPGEIRVAELEPTSVVPALGHTMPPGTLLALCLTLFGRAPHAWIVTVTGADFGLGEGLSETVEREVDEAVNRILLLLRNADAILRSCP